MLLEFLILGYELGIRVARPRSLISPALRCSHRSVEHEFSAGARCDIGCDRFCTQRSFLRAVDAYIAVNGPVGPEAEIAAWMDWARGVAQTLQENAIRTLLTYRLAPAE